MVEANWGAPPAYGGNQAQQVEISYHLPEEPAAEPAGEAEPRVAAGGGALNVVGAVLSLALLVGLGLWGYRLAVRDVTGVPVVRALAGPMRIQPEDPGGEEAAYQGYAVNAVQGEGGVAPPADTLALAPRDTGLAPDDMEVAAPETVAMAAPAPNVETAPELQALADQIADGVAPLTEVAQTSSDGVQAALHAADQAVAQAVASVQSVPASVPGITRAPRPPVRPAALVTVAAAPATAPVAPGPAQAAPAFREIAASDIAAGTQLVQLGAFDSPEVARTEWAQLAARFEDYFGDKSMVLMEAKSGGRSFWRLRAAGFADLADARRFCAVLDAARAAWIPVVTR